MAVYFTDSIKRINAQIQETQPNSHMRDIKKLH